MRNFSKAVHVQHLSYSINCGEYGNNVDVMSVLRDLAKAFESPLSSVIHDFNCVSQGKEGEAKRLCPSEVDVLMNLFEFVRYVSSIDDFHQCDDKRAFVYINLNTGSTVTWVHATI